MIRDPYAGPDDIGVGSDQLAFIILKARAFDAEVDALVPDEGSNETDDHFVEALESGRDNPNRRELRAAISALDEDAQTSLVALAWIGRGDYEPEEWSEALKYARERRKDGPTARYLLGLPMLGDLIEAGADALGVNLTSEEQIGMHHPVTEKPAEEDRS